MGVHGSGGSGGGLAVVKSLSPDGTPHVGTEDRRCVAGRGVSRAVLSQRGQGRVLGENLGQERRVEARQAVLRQGGGRPAPQRQAEAARGLAAATAAHKGRVLQAEAAGRSAHSIVTEPRHSVRRRLQVAQNGADRAGDERAGGRDGGRRRESPRGPPWHPLLEQTQGLGAVEGLGTQLGGAAVGHGGLADGEDGGGTQVG